jgi:hypothetical protein
MRKRNKGTNQPTPEVVTPEVGGTEVVVEAPEGDRAEFEALAARREALVAELAEVEGTLAAQYRSWWLLSSVVAKPVALCREVFLNMVVEAGGVPQRKVVLETCTKKGVSPNTAKTQYQVNRTKYLAGQFDEQLSDLLVETEV